MRVIGLIVRIDRLSGGDRARRREATREADPRVLISDPVTDEPVPQSAVFEGELAADVQDMKRAVVRQVYLPSEAVPRERGVAAHRDPSFGIRVAVIEMAEHEQVVKIGRPEGL